MDPIAPAEIGRRLETLKLACRKAGLRMTPQRMEIYREVARTSEHPDAETVFRRIRERMPNVSHDTVYRTLASLEEMGLISRVDPTGGRARFDANCDKHHHFICTKCGSIADLYLGHEQAIPLPDNIREFGSIGSLHLQIRGVCKACEGQ